MTFSQELQARGILKQITAEDLPQRIDRESLTLYSGFDPTSDSLHVGNLLPLLTLRRFQKAGHRVIAVVGGATGMIGDPSGKNQERSLLTPEVLEKNVRGIRQVISRFLDFEGTVPARLENNGDWFKNLTFIDFLRDVGKHFTVNHMMAKESVRARLEDREHGISYTEFSYMLLQAYDFYILHQKWGCTLQVGGSDQWGNITAGIELMRRMNAGQGYGITHPLVTKSDGSKFGKTETGAIWLDANRTSPYQFFQFWIQTPDSDVSQYLRFFSFKSISEIEKLENSVKTQPEKREAQLALAREMVELVHGKEALETALNASEVLFGGDPTHASLAVWKELSQTIPTHSISLERWKSGAVTLIDLLAESQLCPSKGQARKDIAQGGVSLNNIKVTDASAPLIEEHLLQGKFLLLRKGKKNYVLITVE